MKKTLDLLSDNFLPHMRHDCNTPGVPIANTIYLQWPLQYLHSVCYSISLIQ
jgi:hypothetical protein